MKQTVRFPGSDEDVDATWILENSSISWPMQHWIYCRVPNKEERMHVEVYDGRMRLIEFLGAPGPDWRPVATLVVPDLRVRIEAERIDCRLGDRKFSFPAR